MSRLPIPGQDDNTWGGILNDYLSVSLNADGTIKTAALGSAGGELVSNKGQPSGYASLNSSGLVPTTQLGGGTASGSNFLRGDGTWVVPNSGSSTLASDTDVSISSPGNTQVLTYNGSKWVNENAPSAPDATGSTPGLVQLSGDLSGSATSPTLTATSNVETIISANTTVLGAAQKASNLSDLASASTARTNLGLGNSATTNVGTTSGTVAAGNDTRISGAVQASAFTAKGDLLAGTGNATFTNVAAGSNGQVAMYDSTQTAGLRSVDLSVIETFSMPNTLAIKTGASRQYFEAAYTITNVRASVGTAPTGSSIIIDVLKNGTTIYTTQGNRPTIAINGNTATANNPDITSISAGDYLTINVAQIGSGTTGADLTVSITARHA